MRFRLFGNISRTLIWTFILLAVLPVGAVMLFSYSQFDRESRQQSTNQLDSVAEVKIQDVRRWLEGSQTTQILVLSNADQYQRMVNILVSETRLATATSQLIEFLKDQLNVQNTFVEFFIYDLQGNVKASTDLEYQAQNIQDRLYFAPSLQDGYIQPPYDEFGNGQIQMVITQPVRDARGNVVGVFAGRLDLPVLYAIMTTRVGLGTTGETYLVSTQQSRLVSPSRFEGYGINQEIESTGIQKALAGENGSGIYENYRGEPVVGVYHWIPELQSAMLAEIEQAETLEAVHEVRDVSLLFGVIAALIAVAIGIWVSLSITRPILALTTVANKVMAGDYNAHANLKNANEIGQLGTAFDTMTAQFQELLETLEQRVADRTRDLELATDVAKRISRLLTLDQLLTQVVQQTRDAFKLSHVFVILLDTQKRELYLRAAAGEVAESIMRDPLRTSLDEQPSLIARAVREQKTVVVNDVALEPDYRFVPELPDTKSELVIPLVLGERVLGALDVQHNAINRFSADDQRAFTTLAEQIAVALGNAQLFEDAQAARHEAEKANLVKSQFLANVSHELRTPLNAILNFTQFVMSGMVGTINEEQVELLSKVVSSGKHLLSLINDVLDISKIESGDLKLFVEDNVNLLQEVKPVIELATPILKDKAVKLETDFPEQMPLIVGDKRRIRQIMLNLVSNACKFTEKGSVKLEMQHNGDHILFAVHDTGPGIAVEDFAIIFENFRQSSSGLEQGEGTGLGLPISLKLTEAHSGKIWVESTVGEGSHFYVSLPIHAPNLVVTKRKKT